MGNIMPHSRYTESDSKWSKILLTNQSCQDYYVNIILAYLQLHAISCHLKSPLPTNVASEQETDFSHVVDFASQVCHLVVEGSNNCYR